MLEGMATRTHRLVPALPLSLAVVCAACAATGPEVTLEDHAPFVAAAGGQGPSLRGLAAPGPDLAWVSGSGGVVARTTDGGRSWSVGDVGVDQRRDTCCLFGRPVHFRGRGQPRDLRVVVGTGRAVNRV